MAPGREAVVFIVEDHVRMLQVLVRLVERTDGLVCCGTAASAEEALQGLPACNPTLLLVDISLPGMDGIELIRHVGQRWPTIKCLAVSGHEEKLYAQAALEAGASGYVMKGEVSQLVAAIHTVLAGDIYVSTDALGAD